MLPHHAATSFPIVTRCKLCWYDELYKKKMKQNGISPILKDIAKLWDLAPGLWCIFINDTLLDTSQVMLYNPRELGIVSRWRKWVTNIRTLLNYKLHVYECRWSTACQMHDSLWQHRFEMSKSSEHSHVPHSHHSGINKEGATVCNWNICVLHTVFKTSRSSMLIGNLKYLEESNKLTFHILL